MAKGSKQKGNKNVFKVAGARSLKAKNKAKAISTTLKKVRILIQEQIIAQKLHRIGMI